MSVPCEATARNPIASVPDLIGIVATALIYRGAAVAVCGPSLTASIDGHRFQLDAIDLDAPADPVPLIPIVELLMRTRAPRPVSGGAPDGDDDGMAFPGRKTFSDRQRDMDDVIEFFRTHPEA